MQTFFKKYFWTAQVAFVVVAALLLAGAVNGFAASALAKFAVAYPEDVPETRVDDSAAVDLAPINPLVFGPEDEPEVVDLCADVECDEDQECNAATGECENIEVEEEVAAPSDGRCIESDIAINLVGTMVSDDDAWSVAILHNPSLNQTQFARIGTNLLAEGNVTRIERGRLFLLRNGREECLRPGDQQTRAQRAQEQNQPPPRPPAAQESDPTPVAARRPTGRTPGSGGTPQGGGSIQERIATQVQRNDDGSYDVPRDLIQEVANDSALLQSQAPTIAPNYVNGQPRGFRLQGVRSDSIFSAIGVRNGDVIVSVNGTELDSPQRALELYQAMLQQNSVSMQVLRRGREQTLRYNIQ